MIRKLLFSISFLLVVLLASAQDIHFSQFQLSYLNLNPAMVGDFNGDYRFNGNFKNQWSSVSEPFRTFSFSVEAKNPIKKAPGLHLGLLIYNDEAGLGGLQTTQANLNASYAYKLNYDSSLVVSAGLQMGLTARSINYDQFSFDQQFNGIEYNPNLGSGENFNQDSYSSFNLHTGIALSYLYEDRKKFKAGAAFYNLTSPNQSFLGSNIPLDLRANYYLQADYYISERIDLLPSLLYSHQGKFQELVFGSNLRYRLDRNQYFKRNLYGGLWYRNQDAIIASVGMDYNQWHVGLSYDINTSSLEVASNNRGGLELSVTYIIQTFNPVIRKYKVCPKFL